MGYCFAVVFQFCLKEVCVSVSTHHFHGGYDPAPASLAPSSMTEDLSHFKVGFSFPVNAKKENYCFRQPPFPSPIR